jgi:hypothetical protein
MKLFELLIDDEDELSGVALLSLVKDPATQISWEMFNDEQHHSCSVEGYDFSNEDLAFLDEVGEEIHPIALQGAKITPVELTLTKEGFVSVPPITSNPREFDEFSGDQQDGTALTRYIYVVDTALGSPLIKTSRPLCRKMILANRVFSRWDIELLSEKLTNAGDTFKLVYRAQINRNVDYFQYKSGKYCRHRWFQIQFPIGTNETTEQALANIPVKADQTRGAIRIGGVGRPFTSEWSLDPPGAAVQMSNEKSLDAVAFHMGVFLYPSRFAALVAEPTAKKLTKVKVCFYEDECIVGWAPIEILPEYYEETAEVLEYFEVRQTFAKVPDYMREAAKRAVDYAEENGWGDCGTDTGKRRANDLADPNYTPSVDILTRMYSYGSRHKVDYESSKSIEDGCGYLMMLSWGFTPDNYDAAMKFLERELEKSTELNVMMSSNEYEGDITAVVFQPNQKIYRWDKEAGQPYYVFMSRETIRKMLMKFQRTKVGKGGIVNLEHSGLIFDPSAVYTYENWLVGDNPELDKSYQIFGRTFEPGTWMTTIHFKDKKLFEDFVLSNRTTGVSLEGMFQEVPFNFYEVKEKEEMVYPNPSETENEFIGRCMGDTQMISEFPDETQRAAVCYSYYREKMEVDYNDDKEMVDGVIELLLQVKDLENRKEIAKEIIRDFALEGVSYDYDDFLNRLGLTDFGFDFPSGTCWEGYEPYGTKIVDGREVPNCVPVNAKKEDMGLIGIDGQIPIYADEYEARAAAQAIGCSGAHQMDGGWAPCDNHNDLVDGLKETEILMAEIKNILQRVKDNL